MQIKLFVLNCDFLFFNPIKMHIFEWLDGEPMTACVSCSAILQNTHAGLQHLTLRPPTLCIWLDCAKKATLRDAKMIFSTQYINNGAVVWCIQNRRKQASLFLTSCWIWRWPPWEKHSESIAECGELCHYCTKATWSSLIHSFYTHFSWVEGQAGAGSWPSCESSGEGGVTHRTSGRFITGPRRTTGSHRQPCDVAIRCNICKSLVTCLPSSCHSVHKHLEIREGQQTRPHLPRATFGEPLGASCSLLPNVKVKTLGSPERVAFKSHKHLHQC